MEQGRAANLGPVVEPLVCEHPLDKPVPPPPALQPQGVRDSHLQCGRVLRVSDTRHK